MQYFSLKFTYGKESKMKGKGDIPNLPPEFNPIIPLRDDSPQREFPIKALPPIIREMVIGIAETTGTDQQWQQLRSYQQLAIALQASIECRVKPTIQNHL